MLILNLPGKTGKKYDIQSVSDFKRLSVRYDERLMYLEDRDFRDKYAKPTPKRKARNKRAKLWTKKQSHLI